MFTDEIRQIYLAPIRRDLKPFSKLKEMLKSWWHSSSWNIIDISYELCFIIAFLIKFICGQHEVVKTASQTKNWGHVQYTV